MESDELFAHISEDGRTHLLRNHLFGTADRAAQFASEFGCGEWGRLAGLWHDLGKYSDDFQRYIRAVKKKGGDHSTAGALLAVQKFEKKGWPLAFVMAGHHAGLANYHDLKARLDARAELLKIISPVASGVPLDSEMPESPSFKAIKPDQLARSQEFWIRMLYSALVDADYLNTEEFMKPEKTANRLFGDSIAALKQRLTDCLGALGYDGRKVNEIRKQIQDVCIKNGVRQQGVFSLSAPTGSGKTLATMAFALNHADKHGLKRVIVVIPFTSIIEQNAKVYRDIFGSNNIIEHHSNLDPKKEDDRNKLACENWDAPIIITTSVQFFESLLANRSSRCRKLHNVTKSVVIFDEVQSLPIGHLIPIVDLLKELVRNYGVSILLSTATQPALGQRTSGSVSFPGFEHVTPLIQDSTKTFEILKRADIIWPQRFDQATSWEKLADEIIKHNRVLAIVHKREDARTLARLLPEDTCHLSALMCAAHRLKVIEEIRSRQESQRTRVVSTQLIEAGVDLDFPVVYRAFGGLDSIAQAAGRCNREGKLPEKGKVYIFVAPTKPPKGTPSKARDVAEVMLNANPLLDPLNPDIYEHYFRQLYFTQNLDAEGIQRDRAEFKFKTVAEKFSMIEDDGSEALVVPYGDGVRRLEDLRLNGSNRASLRALQPFTVNLYPKQIRALESAGALELVAETVKAILPSHYYLYSERFGLVLEGPMAADPVTLVSSN